MEKVKSIPLTLYSYNQEEFKEEEVTLSELEEGGILHQVGQKNYWLNLDEEDPVLLNRICELFQVHSLVKEDILHFQTLAYRINALLVGLSVNLTKLGISLEQEIMSEKINFINSLIDESEMLSQQLATKKEKKNLSVKLKTS